VTQDFKVESYRAQALVVQLTLGPSSCMLLTAGTLRRAAALEQSVFKTIWCFDA
jgi:hypothetical protein